MQQRKLRMFWLVLFTIFFGCAKLETVSEVKKSERIAVWNNDKEPFVLFPNEKEIRGWDEYNEAVNDGRIGMLNGELILETYLDEGTISETGLLGQNKYPLRLRAGFGRSLYIERHSGYLGHCIKRTQEHINVRWKIDDRNVEVFNLHITWWRNQKGRFCMGGYITGEMYRGEKKPCINTCFDRLRDTQKRMRKFIEYHMIVAFGIGTGMFLTQLMWPVIVEAIAAYGFVFAAQPAEIAQENQDSPVYEDELPVACPNDVPLNTPLPHEFNPSLTVVARNSTGLHVIGNEADQYLFTQFYADPNPANLLAVWIQGNWNGFSMGFEIPYGYNKFAPAKQQGANFLPAGGANTRVADGVQVINGGFVLTCGNRINNEQLLTDADMIHYPVECSRDVNPDESLPQNFRQELVVLTRRWGLHVIGHEADQYRFCQWYADPNPANLPAIWNNGTWNGFSMYFEEPYGYNKFTPAKQQGRDFLPAGDRNTRVSSGVQIINQGFSYTCGQRLNNDQILSDIDFVSPEPEPEPQPQPEPGHQGLYLERNGNQIIVENGERWPYILWWAIPNPNNLISVWLQGSFDGNYTYFDIPQGRNRFVISETNVNPRPEQFYPVGSNQAELGNGIRIIGTDFEIEL